MSERAAEYAWEWLGKVEPYEIALGYAIVLGAVLCFMRGARGPDE